MSETYTEPAAPNSLSTLLVTNQINRQIAALPEPDRLALLARLLGREAVRIRAAEGLEPKGRPTMLEEGCVFAADRTLADDEAPPEAWLNVATGIVAQRLQRSYPEYTEDIIAHAGLARLVRDIFDPAAGAGIQVNG